MTNITPPPPHLLKKFSEQAREDSKKRGHPGYCKTFAILCIEWAMNSQSTPNDRQIRSSDITPPPELVQQWYDKAFQNPTGAWSQQVATQAAQYGADQELEACCKWLDWQKLAKHENLIAYLRAARRPQPPSLKEQALTALERYMTGETILTNESVDTIRRALEALPE